jgi:hypothetical protein
MSSNHSCIHEGAPAALLVLELSDTDRPDIEDGGAVGAQRHAVAQVDDTQSNGVATSISEINDSFIYVYVSQAIKN